MGTVIRAWFSSERMSEKACGVGRTIFERLWEKVDVRGGEECWPWIASTSAGKAGGGYGRIYDGRKRRVVPATYIALESIGVVVPNGLNALHSCDNPPCCNPRHLRPGTKLENGRDKVERGRAKGASNPGESNGSSKLKTDQVRLIRELRFRGATLREVASAFGVSEALVSMIDNRKVWAHL